MTASDLRTSPPSDATSGPPWEPPRRSATRWLLGILLLAMGIYAPSLRNDFAMDDFIAKAAHESEPSRWIAELQPLADYFGAHYWDGVFGRSELYRPFTILSYAWTHAVVGKRLPTELEAVPHHAGNVLLHVFAVWLVYRLARRLRVDRRGALCAGAVFAAHAIHSEAVAGIVGRAELLAFTAGGFATWLMAGGLRARRSVETTLRGLLRVAAGGTGFFIALCSKESAVAWLPCAALVAWAAAPERSLRAASGGVAPALVAFSLAAIPWWALRSSMLASQPEEPIVLAYVANPLAHLDAAARIANATVLWVYGLGKLCLPFWLYADYSAEVFPLVDGFGHWLPWAAVLALAALAGCGLWPGRSRPLRLTAVAMLLTFSFVTSNVPVRDRHHLRRTPLVRTIGRVRAVDRMGCRVDAVPLAPTGCRSTRRLVPGGCGGRAGAQSGLARQRHAVSARGRTATALGAAAARRRAARHRRR